MKITLDHNCIINIENATPTGKIVQKIVANPAHQCFVVNIGASEMRQKGVRPDNYASFEKLLTQTGLSHLARLNPLGIFDVTFFDQCVLAGDQDIQLISQIENALFENAEKIDIETVGLESIDGKKWLNRLCDVHGLWCHIQNKNDVFLTTDSNFTKQTKLPKLLSLGAQRICHPQEL